MEAWKAQGKLRLMPSDIVVILLLLEMLPNGCLQKLMVI